MACTRSRAATAISTHALREEGDAGRGAPLLGNDISTHALREEGDYGSTTSTSAKGNFYPRPPRGGRPVKVTSLFLR